MNAELAGYWMFVYGAGASLAVEVAEIVLAYDKNQPLPEKYTKFLYWTARIALAILAGGLVLAYEIKSPGSAIHIGASAPLILRALSQMRPERLQHIPETTSEESAAIGRIISPDPSGPDPRN